MDIQILKVKDAGKIEDERIILKVERDCNINWYLLFDNTFDEAGNLSNLWRHLYIFPNIEVKAGDFIWLYTKCGTNSNRPNDSNTTTYLLYWGLQNTIWNSGGEHEVAHLVKYEDSQSKKV